MKSSAICRAIITGAFLVLVPSIGLAVPGLINFQGRLTDDAGVPITGDRPVVFSLYTTAAGGGAVWTESRTVTLTDGAFSLELGSRTPIPSDLFSEDSLYLGVKVDTDPEMAPRQRITSVGYAYSAESVKAYSDSSAAPVYVNTRGTGPAAEFLIDNAVNTSPAVNASTSGGGPAVRGETTGTNYAGYFRINNAGSFANSVYAQTNGGGDAFKGETTGTGKAGEFRVLSPANSSAAVYGLNNGTGNAGYFLISNTGSAAPAVYANTLGSGPAGQFDGDVQVSGKVYAASFAGDGSGLSNVNASTAAEANHASSADDAGHADSADTATNADNAALLNSMSSANIIDAASDEVRIPISSVPFTIISSGSYYFTGDLTATDPSSSAIDVYADNVTIDMMGYSLTGPGRASGTNYGIYMNGQKNVEIRNGTVCNFGSTGIREPNYPAGQGDRAINMRVINNGGSGIYLNGYNHLVKDCTVWGNGANGIYAYALSTMTGNTVYDNDGYGINGYDSCMITGNTSYNNQQSGIYGYTKCTINGNMANNNNLLNELDGGGITTYLYCTVKGNTAQGNYNSNIYIGSSGNAVEENIVTGTSGTGIRFYTSGNFYANNRARGNSMGNYSGSVPTGQGDGGGNASF